MAAAKTSDQRVGDLDAFERLAHFHAVNDNMTQQPMSQPATGTMNNRMTTERAQTRVLVVDDEESQRTALAAMIALWGYAVETAADGQEALDKLADGRFHVVVTDMMMPRVDGSGAAQAPESPRRRAAGDRPDRVWKPGNGGGHGPRPGRVLVPGKAGAVAGTEARCWSAPRRRAVWRNMPSAWNASSATRACWARWWALRRRCRKPSPSSIKWRPAGRPC